LDKSDFSFGQGPAAIGHRVENCLFRNFGGAAVMSATAVIPRNPQQIGNFLARDGGCAGGDPRRRDL
jgi:hypothetical protein